MNSNSTKATNISNSIQSIQSNKNGLDDINVSVGLPKIENAKNKHLAAIDDDYEEDYDERVPQKPKNLTRKDAEEIDQNKASNSLKQLNNQSAVEKLSIA